MVPTFHGHAFLGSGKENWRLGALLAVTSVGAVRGHQQRMGQTTPSTLRGQGALETASLPVDSPPRKRRSSMKLYNANLSNFASKCRLASPKLTL